MMKLPFALGDGLVPSGNSWAVTYPGECGSRVGGVGRGARGAVAVGGGGVCASNVTIGAAKKTHNPTLLDFRNMVTNACSQTLKSRLRVAELLQLDTEAVHER